MRKENKKNSKAKKISRKAAINKLGFAAFTGASMMFLVNNPAKAQDGEGSPDIPPPW